MNWHKIKRRKSDIMFSRLVRYRDDWKCQNCGAWFPEKAQNLHCSHFHSRSHKSVRWDLENCDAMCANCHRYWESHRTEYEAWKLEQLGQRAYDLLELRKNTRGNNDETIAIAYVKKLIEELERDYQIKVEI